MLPPLRRFCYQKISAKPNNAFIDTVDLHSGASSLSLCEPVAKWSRNQQPVGEHFEKHHFRGPWNSVPSQDHLLKWLPLAEKGKHFISFQYSKKEVVPLIKPLNPCLVSEGIRNPLNSLMGRYSEGFGFELWPDR